MRVLLLGGTGFIGTAATTALRASGHQTTTVGRGATADVIGEATDPLSIERILGYDNFDVVVNLFGTGLSAGTADARTMTAVNTTLPGALPALLATRAPTTRLVHAASSTERVPGQSADESDYSRTKHEGTQALVASATALDVPTTVLSIHNTYGPGQPAQRFVAHVIGRLSADEPVELRYPGRIRDFVFIDDVAACLVAAVERTHGGLHRAEAGTGTGTSLRDASLLIAEAVGASPALVLSGGAPTDDPNPTTVAHDRSGTYGLCTTTLADGIRRTIQEA